MVASLELLEHPKKAGPLVWVSAFGLVSGYIFNFIRYDESTAFNLPVHHELVKPI